MKNILKSFLLGAALLLGTSLSFGQTLLTTTTLSAATGNSSTSVTGLTGTVSVVSVASATGISAPSPNGGNTYGYASSNAQTYLYVDRELMQVVSVSGTNITVIRGVGSTAASSHASGALVFVVPAADVQGDNSRYNGAPSGSCTRSNELYLPHIQYTAGVISDCLNGQWANGDAMQTTRSVAPIQLPGVGGTLYTALDTAGTTLAATTMYCTEIQMPYSKLVTGLAVLNGTTVGTDKHLVALYDAGGNLVANSATAGATSAGASAYQQYAFTSPYYMVGPSIYYACAQTNGTTDTIRMLVTSADQGLFTKGVTGQTFGTVPATFTVPTTFTTAVGPYWEVY